MLAASLFVAEAALSIWDPMFGVLALALVGPSGPLIANRFGSSIQVADVLALAFLVGWLWQPHGRRRGPTLPRISMCAIWLAALATAWRLASAIGAATDPATGLQHVVWSYLLGEPRLGFQPISVLAHLTIAAAAVSLFRRRPAIARTLPAAVLAGTAAAIVVAGGGGFEIRPPLPTGVAIARLAADLDIVDALGAAGAVLFVAGAIWRTVRGIAARPGDARLVLCAASAAVLGVVSALSSAAGAPAVAISAWLLLGLAVGLAGSNLLRLSESAAMRSMTADNVRCGR